MPTFTATSPFVEGKSPGKTRLDKLLDNTLWLKDQLRRDFGVVNGLVRTAPGKTDSLTKVQLARADRIHFVDGRSAALTAPLASNIAVTGAGGLDQGTPTNSRWYQPYVAIKDDGTMTLLLRLLRAYIVDQQQTTITTALGLNDATARTWHAQSFTAGATAKALLVELALSRTGTPSGEVWIELQADSSGSPSGVTIASTVKLIADVSNNNNEFLYLPFEEPNVTLAAGSVYWLVLKQNYSTSATNYLQVYYNDTDLYAGGAHKRWDGSAWQVDSASRDLAFKVIIISDETPTLALPSGYVTYTKAGPPVYRDGSGNFVRFVAIDGHVIPLKYDTSSAGIWTIGSTGATNVMLPFEISHAVPPDHVLLWGTAGSGNQLYAQLFPVPDGDAYANASAESLYGRWGGLAQAYLAGSTLDRPTAQLGPIPCWLQRVYGANSGGLATKFWVDGWLWRG